MKIKKLICLECGNTEDFIVDSRRESVGGVLHFEDDVATLDDLPSNDVEIIPAHCANCNAHVWGNPGGIKIEKKDEKICKHCYYRFQCFTERYEAPIMPRPIKKGFVGITDPIVHGGVCRGFEFENETIYLEDTC